MHEVFGSPDQQRMQIKGEQLMHLLSGDIRFVRMAVAYKLPITQMKVPIFLRL
jgi:hypothetical protein